MNAKHGLEGANLGAVIHHLQCLDPSDSVLARLDKMMTIAETVADLVNGRKASLRNPPNITSCEAWRMWELWLELFSQTELAPLADKVEALSLLRPWMEVHAPEYLTEWEKGNGIPMRGHLNLDRAWFEPRQGRTLPSVPNVTQNSLATMVAKGMLTGEDALLTQVRAEKEEVWINYRSFGKTVNTESWEDPVWAEAYCRLLPPDFHVDFKEKAIPGFEKWRAGRNQRAARGRYQTGQLPTLAYWVSVGLLTWDEANQIYWSKSAIPAAMTHGWPDATEVYLAQGVFTGEEATRFVHAWTAIQGGVGGPYTGTSVILEQWVKPEEVRRILKARDAIPEHAPAPAVDKESLNWWPGVLRKYAGNVATGTFTPSMARALWKSYLRGEGPGISNGVFDTRATTRFTDTHQAFGYVTDRAIEGMNLNMRHGTVSQAATWIHDVLREEANSGPFTTLSPNALKTLKVLCLHGVGINVAAEILTAAIEWDAVVSYHTEVTARDGATSDDVETYWTSILSHPSVTRLTGGNQYEEQRLAWRAKNYVYHIPARAYKELKEERELEQFRRGLRSLGHRSPQTVHSLATALEVRAYDFSLDRARADVARGHIGDGTLRTFRDGIVPQGPEFTTNVVRVWCEIQEKVTLQSLALLLPWVPLRTIVDGVASWNGEVADAKKDWLTRDLVNAFGPWENFLDGLARWVASGQKTAIDAEKEWASYVRATRVAQKNGQTVLEAPQSHQGGNLDPIEVLAARTSILSRSRELLNPNTVGMATVAGALTLQECLHNVDGMVARTDPNIEVDSKVLTPLMGKDTIAKDEVSNPTMDTDKGRPVKRGTYVKEDVVCLALLVALGRLTPDRARDLWLAEGRMVSYRMTDTNISASVAQETSDITRDMERITVKKGPDFGTKFVRIWNWLTDLNPKGETWNVDRDLADYVSPDVLARCTNDDGNLMDELSLALSKSLLNKELEFSKARLLWDNRFDLHDDRMEKFAQKLKDTDCDNAELMKEMLSFASCLHNPGSFLNIGAFSNEATIEGLYQYLQSLDEGSAAEDTVMTEVARWVPDSVAEALMKFPASDWRVGHFRGLPGVGDHMQAPVKKDIRDELSPSMQMALSLAFLCSIGTLTVTEAAQDLAAYIRYGAIPKDPETLDLNKIPTDSSLRETVANILAHPLMTSLGAVGTYLPQPRLHEFDVYQARLAEEVMKSGRPVYQAGPTKGEIAIETIKSDAREIALRTGVRRVRAAIAEKFSAWWSRQNHPRTAGETEDAYGQRLEAGRTQAQAFLGTDMGEASLAMLAGFVWTVVGEDVSNEQVRMFGDAVAREMRVSAGTDILDAVVTEVLRPTMAEIQAILPPTGVRVQAATVQADDDDQDLRAGESLARRA